VIPETLAPAIVKNVHRYSHMGKSALEQLLCQHFYVPCLTSLASNICKQCEMCQKITPNRGHSLNQESSRWVVPLLKTWK
jgi:hypothetical protein